MSRRRAKTPGWAAFDPKKQQRQVTGIETQDDPYPPISSYITTLHHCQNLSRNDDLTGKSFSSVLTHSGTLPNIIPSEDTHTRLMENNRSEKMASKYIEKNVSQLFEKLTELHQWANETLIEDIVAGVDNDIDRASNLLREMAPHGRLQHKKEAEFEEVIEDVCIDNPMLKNTGLTIKNDEPVDDHACSGDVRLDENVRLGLMMDMIMVPIEPEWEDDDLYLKHRKEAIRAMRLASRHSKAATEAYIRRDHAAAQEFSLKAQQEWSNAEKLNAKAAKEILAIRNSENDVWKLDLHGLHAKEAVQVLSKHLLKVESQVAGTHSTKPDKTDFKVLFTQAVSLDSVSLETMKRDSQQPLYNSRPRLLEVITGKGNHSRGQAALPVAIKSFLSEKGYYYYEARSGVITVQPKFRQLSTGFPVHSSLGL